MLDDRRARIEADRRTGFDRRIKDVGRAGRRPAAAAIAASGRAASAITPARSI